MLDGTPDDVTVVVSPTLMVDGDTLRVGDGLVGVIVGVIGVGVGVIGVGVGVIGVGVGVIGVAVGVGVDVGVAVGGNINSQYSGRNPLKTQSQYVLPNVCPVTPSSSSTAPDGPPPSGGDCAMTALTTMNTQKKAAPQTSAMRCMSFLRIESP